MKFSAWKKKKIQWDLLTLLDTQHFKVMLWCYEFFTSQKFCCYIKCANFKYNCFWVDYWVSPFSSRNCFWLSVSHFGYFHVKTNFLLVFYTVVWSLSISQLERAINFETFWINLDFFTFKHWSFEICLDHTQTVQLWCRYLFFISRAWLLIIDNNLKNQPGTDSTWTQSLVCISNVFNHKKL